MHDSKRRKNAVLHSVNPIKRIEKREKSVIATLLMNKTHHIK